jgi:hypothetical protein
VGVSELPYSLPVCLPCYRNQFDMRGDPPRDGGWPERHCVLCSRFSNHGIRVPHHWIRAVFVLADWSEGDVILRQCPRR